MQLPSIDGIINLEVRKIGNYTVYMHRCKENEKVYVGITNNVKRRWRLKGIEYRPHKDENQNRPFWNAIKKYGWENFEHITLEYGLTFEEAIEVEKGYIDLYDSTNRKYGYNVSKGGNGGLIYEVHPRGMKGKKQTEHQINSHREWASNKDNNCMTNGQVIWGVTHPHPKGMKGKKHSEEYKARLRKNRGKNATFRREVKATLPNGKVKVFHTVRECADYLNVSCESSFMRKLLKTGEPYKMHPSTARRRGYFKTLEGLRLEYVSENTEVIS